MDKTLLIRNRRRWYALGAISLFLIEVAIALWVRDDFVRPFLGDFLVVILIYCAVMACTPLSVRTGLVLVLVFSFTVEGLQAINFSQLLGWNGRIARTVLGTNFSVLDLIMYVMGMLFCWSVEYVRSRKVKATENGNFYR